MCGGGEDGTQAGYSDGIGSNALFLAPLSIAMSTENILYVTDLNGLVRRIVSSGKSVCLF